MRKILKKLLERTELIFAIALITPFLIHANVGSVKYWIQIALGIVFFFSIRPFFKHKLNIQKSVHSIVKSIALNYILLSGIYVLLGWLFLRGDGLFNGYILMAIVPPAISIVPLCYLSRCNPEIADSAIFIAYLLSLAIIPGSLFLIYGKTIDFGLVAEILATLIIIPGILAFLTRKSKSGLFSWSKAIVNLCLGSIIFISTSLNRGAFLDFSNPEIGYVYLINTLAIFGTGFLAYHLTKKKSFEQAVTYTLYSSQKNVGTAITLALLLFSPAVAIPAIIALAMQFVYFIFFEKVIIKYDN